MQQRQKRPVRGGKASEQQCAEAFRSVCCAFEKGAINFVNQSEITLANEFQKFFKNFFDRLRSKLLETPACGADLIEYAQ